MGEYSCLVKIDSQFKPLVVAALESYFGTLAQVIYPVCVTLYAKGEASVEVVENQAQISDIGDFAKKNAMIFLINAASAK